MEKVSLDLLTCCLSFLTIEETVRSSQINSQFLTAVRQERLWQIWLSEQLGLPYLEYPPGSDQPVNDQDRTFQHCFKSWRMSFSGYRFEDIRRTRIWWKRFETWCAQYSPEILSTLNPPASELELNSIEIRLKSRLPSPLRLFYRFHNGQTVPFDSDRNHTASIGWGMFGGTHFYDSFVNMRFLSLEALCLITQHFQLSESEVLSHPKLNGTSPAQNILDSLSLIDSQLYQNDDNIASPISNHSDERINHPLDDSRDLIIFAANGVRRIQKVYCIGRDSPSSRGGVIYVNTREYQYIPCHPLSHKLTSSTPSNLESFFILWLEEYLIRLETEVYCFQPVDLTDPAVQLNQPSMQMKYAIRMISLHPLRPIYNPVSLFFGEYSRRNYGATTCITRGVECIACPVFIPEKSSSEEYFWSYSIRLRLLKHHPDRPTTLTKCQLISRHWNIFAPPTPEALNTGTNVGQYQRIDGEAVIGLYPQLDISYSQPPTNWPFAYQSCTTSSTFPGQFSGYMKFVPGSIQSPNGPPFEVNLEPFSLGIPDFIY